MSKKTTANFISTNNAPMQFHVTIFSCLQTQSPAAANAEVIDGVTGLGSVHASNAWS